MRQTSLFDKKGGEHQGNASGGGPRAPLAERMRPRTLDEVVGQRRLLEPGRFLERLLSQGQMQSFIMWGPPGCGKTTLAGIIAAHTDAHLIALSAVMAGSKEIRAAVEEARGVWAREHRRTWLFMDEIHRLNKAQQDTLLPHVEHGAVFLLGATTENPSFEVIRPLLSRAQVLVLEPLGEEALKVLVRRALADKERGLGDFPAQLTEEAESYLSAASGGDARICLNAVEAAVLTTPPGADGIRTVGLAEMHEALQRLPVHYDKGGEEHYNLISALHKSVRGSDPDASLYWLARMLEGGEDPLYLARRIIRMAVEDIGLADPYAMTIAVTAAETYERLGSPEGELALAEAVVYLSLSAKSNSVYTAFGKAREMAKRTGSHPSPLHIRNAPTALLKTLGYGREYRYPHDDPSGWVPEIYLPDALAGSVFYDPTVRGWEGKWRETVLYRRRQSEAARKAREEGGAGSTKNPGGPD